MQSELLSVLVRVQIIQQLAKFSSYIGAEVTALFSPPDFSAACPWARSLQRLSKAFLPEQPPAQPKDLCGTDVLWHLRLETCITCLSLLQKYVFPDAAISF